MLIAKKYKIINYSKKYIALLIFTVTIVISPWILRNSLLFNEFVYISTNSGINLLYGNSENTSFDSGVVDISSYRIKNNMNEVEIDNFYKKAAFSWVSNNSLNALILYIKKVANYFNYQNQISTSIEQYSYKNLLMIICYYPLVLLSLIRLLMWNKYKITWTEFLLYGVYYGNAFLSAIVFTRIRYRVPFDYLLIALVAIFIGHIIDSRNIKNK